ncbi:MAG: glycosyltransferase family 2 protein, partial [Sulfitobacter sp.]|nr:glycosyltransferase family 2 protein [Sulfitobacter sp.]
PALVQPLRRLRQRPTLLPDVDSLLEHLDITPPPAPAQDNAGLPAGNPMFDTIVTVFSCIPYLDTRIPEMRSGWLSLLEDLSVPYVVVVGNGDGTRNGDIVHLDAPDDYEGLPQKTLAAIKWVHDNTRFGHMLKIDDDCFLNAPLFFGALSYRKFDYYGRRLYRAAGQMDRKWHQSKSSSLRGQLDLDKSPEPSEYTDGGTAYALSRTAMAAALTAANSAQGRELIALSFMEDKMLGDLLALQGIRPADEDYRIALRRRTYGAATPVPMWQNSFFASATADIQLVHLDTHLDQTAALARLDTPGLWPRKIWPSYQDTTLGYQSNALELISSEATVARARTADVAVVACMRNEMFMLPQFLAHYRKLGVSAFLIADNCSDDGTLEYLQQQPDVALFSVDTDYNLSHYGVAWQQAMMSAFRMGKWSLVADADELLVWQEKQTQTLGELLKTSDFEHANAARIFMLDMYPQGPLEQADFATQSPFEQAGFADRVPFLTNTLSRGPYSNQPGWTSALRHRLITGS